MRRCHCIQAKKRLLRFERRGAIISIPSKRQAVAIHNRHDFHAALGRVDLRAPPLAITKAASMKQHFVFV
jgi:hypothetical protein